MSSEIHLPSPGELVIHDYRTNKPVAVHESLKVLQWNIERNYGNLFGSQIAKISVKLIMNHIESEAIIKIIQDLDPDVIILQEVDVFCKRSGNRDHMQELCKSLELLGGFVCEFEELDSPIRKLRDAVSSFCRSFSSSCLMDF
jgi:hypothetical protein